MGTGKTAVGRELAKSKRWCFADLDELIELKEKMTTSDIFARKGEPWFRRIERRVLKEVAKEKGFVVACGGGVVLDEDNIRLMKATGKIICLTAKPEVILKRVSGTAERPLLNVPNPKERIGLLLKLRAPYYAQADESIDTAKFSVKEVAVNIIKLSKKWTNLKR